MGVVSVREAQAGDARAMAWVHVESWRETYREIMADAILDDPDAAERRDRFWQAALTDDRYAQNRTAVAEHDGEIIGIAMAGPQQQSDNDCDANLHLVYVLASYHGSGAGPALLGAVLDPEASASLWVVDPNPRAQAFYRKHGFRPDGNRRLDDGVSEIRMTRPARQTPTPTARQN